MIRESSPVLVLIDMQNYFLLKNSDHKLAIIPNQLKVIEFFKPRKCPLIVVEFKERGSLNSSLVEPVTNYPNLSWVTKNNDDAFTEKKFGSILDSLQAKSLILMGINADYCVYKTAKSAVSRGLEVLTSRDLIAGCEAKDRRWELWYHMHTTFKNSTGKLLKEF